jgi:hypothetical protein
VHGNLSAYNGTAGFHGNAAGSGAGVVLATFLPGGAVYGNSVSGNKLYANGLAGVVVHFHYPGGEFGGGNSITGNAIGKNNVNGDTLDAPITTSDMATTGIVLLGAPLTLTTVNGNVISNDTYGIWHNPAMALKGTNTYHSVTTPVKTERVPFGSAFCGAGPNGPNRVCSGASHTSMTLTGLGVANGYPTSYHFNYGTSRTALTSSTTPASLGKGATVVAVSTTVNHLSPHTTYYFQLVLTNRIGTASGVILSFTTA